MATTLREKIRNVFIEPCPDCGSAAIAHNAGCGFTADEAEWWSDIR